MIVSKWGLRQTWLSQCCGVGLLQEKAGGVVRWRAWKVRSLRVKNWKLLEVMFVVGFANFCCFTFISSFKKLDYQFFLGASVGCLEGVFKKVS